MKPHAAGGRVEHGRYGRIRSKDGVGDESPRWHREH